jgi:ABC-2 type transport system ATP-binding protein
MGKTVIISSHILLELAEMCTDIAIIQGGRLVTAGDVDKVTRSLDGARQLEIRVMDRCAEAVEMLKGISGISNVMSGINGENNLIQTDFTGDDEALHRMLVELITSDIPIVSFAPRSSGGRLEEVFMSITEGIQVLQGDNPS